MSLQDVGRGFFEVCILGRIFLDPHAVWAIQESGNDRPIFFIILICIDKMFVSLQT